MNASGNTILITGGSEGIGLALAESLLDSNNVVIACSRNMDKLEAAKARLPDLEIMQCDISRYDERRDLFNFILKNYKNINILINNAGIQRMIDFNEGIDDYLDGEDEIEINFKALVELSALFIPVFRERKESAIINVSSGLAFVPGSFAPIYCATKAAVHSFTKTLRHQLKDTGIKVFELIPPMVDTNLGGTGRDDRDVKYRGIPAKQVAAGFMESFESNEYEIAVGDAKNLVKAATSDPKTAKEAFDRMNGN